jgi:hypothetical protein
MQDGGSYAGRRVLCRTEGLMQDGGYYAGRRVLCRTEEVLGKVMLVI